MLPFFGRSMAGWAFRLWVLYVGKGASKFAVLMDVV
jgi:hypothetical protein